MTTEFENAAALKEEIKNLTKSKVNQQRELKVGLHHIIQSLKPVNLLKSSVKTVLIKPSLAKSLLASAVSTGVIILAKTVLTNNKKKTIVGLPLIGLATFIANRIILKANKLSRQK